MAMCSTAVIVARDYWKTRGTYVGRKCNLYFVNDLSSPEPRVAFPDVLLEADIHHMMANSRLGGR
jgi:hypothetical protein